MNKIMFKGYLVEEPKVNTTQNGSSVVRLRVGINENYKNRDGEPVVKKSYATVKAWNGTAEFVGRNFRKGSPILVEGKLDNETWKGANGETRTIVVVQAQRIDFAGGKPIAKEGAEQAAA